MHDDTMDDELTFAEEDELAFADEDASEEGSDERTVSPWKILLVDDEPNVHQVTKLALDDLKVDHRGVELISAFSGQEGRARFESEDDIALAIVDVIMETDTSGLELVEYVRNELKNKATRLILRTGQPGQAPERDIVQKYDINDYKSKTELTSSRLFTSVVASLRGYRDLIELKRHSEELSKINRMSQSLYQLTRVDSFASTMVDQLHSTFNFSKDTLVLERRRSNPSRLSVLVQNFSLLPPVAPLIDAEVLCAEIPSLRLFLESKDAIHVEGPLFMTRLQSEERELIFVHHQSADVDELNEESISLLIQQLETAYANTTLYDDHLELNLAMERFVPDSTLKHLEHQSITSVDIGQRATVTASTLSLDIRGFTSLCEKLTSNDSFRLINALLALLGPVIERHHGSILKFVGDGIIAMFSRGKDHIQDAVKCGIELAEVIRAFNATPPEHRAESPELDEPIRVGIGVHTGQVRLGTVGAASRIDVSVRGTSVVMAELLQTLTKPFGITLLIDDSSAQHLAGAVQLRDLGSSSSFQKQRINLYQVISAEDAVLRAKIVEHLESFTSARQRLESGQVEAAASDFASLRSHLSEDPVFRHFEMRAEIELNNRRKA